MDNTERIVRQLEALEHQLNEIRGDLRVLREESKKHTDALELIQAITEAT